MAAAQEKGNVMPGPAPRSITVSTPQREVLERLLRQHSCPQALALRVRIVLRTAGGARVEPLARELHCTADTVQKWRDRWAEAEAQLAAACSFTAAPASAVRLWFFSLAEGRLCAHFKCSTVSD